MTFSDVNASEIEFTDPEEAKRKPPPVTQVNQVLLIINCEVDTSEIKFRILKMRNVNLPLMLHRYLVTLLFTFTYVTLQFVYYDL